MACTLSTQLVFLRRSALLLWKPDIGFEVEISGMVDEWLMGAVKGYLVMVVSGLELRCSFPYGFQETLLYCAHNCKCQMPYQTVRLLAGQRDISSPSDINLERPQQHRNNSSKRATAHGNINSSK